MVKGIDSAYDYIELCLVLQVYISDFEVKLVSRQNFQVATFCYRKNSKYWDMYV